MYQNLTDALTGSLRLLLTEGVTVPSRNGETKELYAHQVRISRPAERVIVTPHRGANIFAQLAETMWVLGGRNDVEFLSRYLPRAKDFSDDGKVWRGGYGPRLRKWQADHYPTDPFYVDQLAECVSILQKDPDSRRAVMVIFDPGQDFVQSKDIPCNNWLHFLIRDGKLNLTVGVRSNDAIWGFSGINMFEWSVLQQMMAHWVGVEVSTMAYTASSFHLYDYHYEKAEKIVSNAKTKTMYDFGVPQIPFKTSFEQFDNAMVEFFYSEKNLTTGDFEFYLEDPLLQATVQMLQIYGAAQREEPVEYICHLLDRLPASDLRVGAVMWLRQQREYKETGLVARLKLSAEETAFIDWYTKPVSSEVSLAEIHEVLKVLHYKKTLSYGDSWRKQGEVLGVFANISRKRDRILALSKGARGTSDEGMMDTVADLCVYSSKYLTLLAELYPVAFSDFLKSTLGGQSFTVDADFYCGVEGFDRALDMLLQILNPKPDPEAAASWQVEIENLYGSFEFLLTSKTRQVSDNLLVVKAAAHLGIWCARAIQILAKENPGMWRSYVESVEKL